MNDEKYDTNLLRQIAAELLFLAGLQTAREMFGKGYWSLGIGEKVQVDQAVLGMIANNYVNLVSPESLKKLTSRPGPGFQGGPTTTQ